MIWALQLNIDQLENSFNSHLEKHFKLVLPSQPNPNQLKIERGNLWKKARTKCKKLVLSKNRDITSSNANKFHLAIDDKNIDFNISGVPNAMVKRSHDINVHKLIQQIENHPQRDALQSDLQQHRVFNPFSDESKDAIMAAANTELCEIVDVEPKSQCRACLTYWDVGIVYCTCGHFLRDNRKQEVYLIRAGSVLHPELLHQERPATRSPVREESRLQRVPHG